MRIRYDENIFWLDNQPLPPGLIVDEEVELIIRLHSTRGRKNARWEAGVEAREALNKAPFEPILRAVVTGFVWSPPDTRDCPSRFNLLGPLADNEVRQLGSATPNWRAFVVRPIGDPLRVMFELVWAAIAPPNAYPVARQGHLEVYGLGDEFVSEAGADRIPYAGSGNRAFFNHYVLGARQWAWRVPAGVAVAVAFLRDGAWVLSPDHPDQPLQFPEGWYALVHPLPQPKRVD